jgi:hypothetical protein
VLAALTWASVFVNEPVPYVEVSQRGRRLAGDVFVAIRSRITPGMAQDPSRKNGCVGGAPNTSRLYRHVRDLLDELGIDRQTGVRRLRHTYTLRQMKAGAPDAVARDWPSLETAPNRRGVTAG